MRQATKAQSQQYDITNAGKLTCSWCDSDGPLYRYTIVPRDADDGRRHSGFFCSKKCIIEFWEAL
jgi:hypothetical protein